jgi:SpoVK/Ycf46/Vps4 family AAA+-type ATPase
VFGRYVGDSEANLRRAFETIELVGRCVVLLDEFDKMFSAGGESDGGTTNRVTGEVLTWLQERTSEAFVIAAMNRVEQIAESRPELIGKGRWDELFFVDLPNVVEREQQFRVHLRKFRVALADKEVTRLAEVTDGFNGAEIEACVKDSLFRAFKQGRRPVIYDDIGIEIGKTVPQSKSARTSIESLRTWAKGRARMASRPIETAQRAGATLEVA